MKGTDGSMETGRILRTIGEVGRNGIFMMIGIMKMIHICGG